MSYSMIANQIAGAIPNTEWEHKDPGLPENTKKMIKLICRTKSDRGATRRSVQKYIRKSFKFKVKEHKTSESSEKVTSFNSKDHKYRIIYKPMSGGMTETTLNSSITELFPCIAFENKIKTKNVNHFYHKVYVLANVNHKCYTNVKNFEAGQQFIEDADSSSKFVEKIKNAIAITQFIYDTDRKKKVKQTYWTYRPPKPKGVPDNSPADIVLEFDDGDMLGVSLKAGGEKTAEPLLNTYVNPIMDFFYTGTGKKKTLRKKLWNNSYSKIEGINEKYDEKAYVKITKQQLEYFEDNYLDEYEAMYNSNLNIIRDDLMKTLTSDVDKFKEYCTKQIMKKSDLPTIIIKAVGKSYKEVEDSSQLATLLTMTESVKAKKSTTSKQNFNICLYDKSNRLLGEMKMSVRSNKVGVDHKLGQFFNLAVKYNGLE